MPFQNPNPYSSNKMPLPVGRPGSPTMGRPNFSPTMGKQFGGLAAGKTDYGSMQKFIQWFQQLMQSPGFGGAAKMNDLGAMGGGMGDALKAPPGILGGSPGVMEGDLRAAPGSLGGSPGGVYGAHSLPSMQNLFAMLQPLLMGKMGAVNAPPQAPPMGAPPGGAGIGGDPGVMGAPPMGGPGVNARPPSQVQRRPPPQMNPYEQDRVR